MYKQSGFKSRQPPVQNSNSRSNLYGENRNMFTSPSGSTYTKQTASSSFKANSSQRNNQNAPVSSRLRSFNFGQRNPNNHQVDYSEQKEVKSSALDRFKNKDKNSKTAPLRRAPSNQFKVYLDDA